MNQLNASNTYKEKTDIIGCDSYTLKMKDLSYEDITLSGFSNAVRDWSKWWGIRAGQFYQWSLHFTWPAQTYAHWIYLLHIYCSTPHIALFVLHWVIVPSCTRPLVHPFPPLQLWHKYFTIYRVLWCMWIVFYSPFYFPFLKTQHKTNVPLAPKINYLLCQYLQLYFSNSKTFSHKRNDRLGQICQGTAYSYYFVHLIPFVTSDRLCTMSLPLRLTNSHIIDLRQNPMTNTSYRLISDWHPTPISGLSGVERTP